MANTNKRHINYYKRKANVIKEYANNSYPGANENSMNVENLKQLVKIIIDITEQKDDVKNQKKKQEGKHYYACLTACSTKLIRIIYALCMNNSTQQN